MFAYVCLKFHKNFQKISTKFFKNFPEFLQSYLQNSNFFHIPKHLEIFLNFFRSSQKIWKRFTMFFKNSPKFLKVILKLKIFSCLPKGLEIFLKLFGSSPKILVRFTMFLKNSLKILQKYCKITSRLFKNFYEGLSCFLSNILIFLRNFQVFKNQKFSPEFLILNGVSEHPQIWKNSNNFFAKLLKFWIFSFKILDFLRNLFF